MLCGCVESNPGPLQNSIKIVQNNVCSLKPKLDIRSVEFASYDIISISETRLDDTVNNLDLVSSVFTICEFNVNILSDDSNNFKDTLERQGFTNLINGPTNFITQPDKFIDLIITNKTQLVETTNILTHVCSSHIPNAICM